MATAKDNIQAEIKQQVEITDPNNANKIDPKKTETKQKIEAKELTEKQLVEVYEEASFIAYLAKFKDANELLKSGSLGIYLGVIAKYMIEKYEIPRDARTTKKKAYIAYKLRQACFV